MATGRDPQSWSSRGLSRRDFRQDHGGGPEEISGHPKRKVGKMWCKRVGREHDWQHVVVHSYQRYSTISEKYITVEDRRWVCQRCGKISWGKDRPTPPVEKHKHDYSDTKIEEIYGDVSYLYEVCVVCGRTGDHLVIRE